MKNFCFQRFVANNFVGRLVWGSLFNYDQEQEAGAFYMDFSSDLPFRVL